jgi:hypothetical protein
MDVDDPYSNQDRRKYYSQEQISALKHCQEQKPHRHKSVIADMDKKNIRKETCRVFVEGEGEIFFKDEKSSTNSVHEQRIKVHNLKNWFNRMMGKSQREIARIEINDKNDHLPSVFAKSEEKSEDVAVEEEDADREVPQSIPYEDNGQLDSSDDEKSDKEDVISDVGDEDEEESCLKEIFPALYGDYFQNERIVEKLANIFIASLGLKGYLRRSPVMFRLFARYIFTISLCLSHHLSPTFPPFVSLSYSLSLAFSIFHFFSLVQKYPSLSPSLSIPPSLSLSPLSLTHSLLLSFLFTIFLLY